jgi:hypothetical protein
VLTTAQEALLSAITESGRFTLDAALARAAGAVRLRLLTEVADATISNVQILHIAREDAAMHSKLEPKK